MKIHLQRYKGKVGFLDKRKATKGFSLPSKIHYAW